MDINFVKDLIYATKRCNDNENIDCGDCMYRESKCNTIYGCIDERATDTIRLLEEWIEEHEHEKGND